MRVRPRSRPGSTCPARGPPRWRRHPTAVRRQRCTHPAARYTRGPQPGPRIGPEALGLHGHRQARGPADGLDQQAEDLPQVGAHPLPQPTPGCPRPRARRAMPSVVHSSISNPSRRMPASAPSTKRCGSRAFCASALARSVGSVVKSTSTAGIATAKARRPGGGTGCHRTLGDGEDAQIQQHRPGVDAHQRRAPGPEERGKQQRPAAGQEAPEIDRPASGSARSVTSHHQRAADPVHARRPAGSLPAQRRPAWPAGSPGPGSWPRRAHRPRATRGGPRRPGSLPLVPRASRTNSWAPRARAKSASWVTAMIAVPRPSSSRSSRASSRQVLASWPKVGSSRIRTCGPAASTVATESRRFSPPERVKGLASARCSSRSRASSRLDPRLDLRVA